MTGHPQDGQAGELEKPGSRGIDVLPAQEASQVETLGAVVAQGPAHGTIKIDLHCHSEASHDCSTPLALIPARCRDRKVRVQAITDHNQVWGAQKLKDTVEAQSAGQPPDITIIVGEEISTTEGEIIGLFLKEKIKGGLTPEGTVERIKAQGGLVLLPHGFDPLKRWRLRSFALERIAASVDIIETFNTRISRLHWNRVAVEWARVHNRLMSAGSDAHTLSDIGSAWVEVPVCSVASPQDLLDALKGGIPTGKWTHPAVAFAYKVWDRTRRRFG